MSEKSEFVQYDEFFSIIHGFEAHVKILQEKVEKLEKQIDKLKK